PGDLDNWYSFTIDWDAEELEGFDPMDLRDVWMYLDRGTENFNGNNLIIDHIVIGSVPDSDLVSPCLLTSTRELGPAIDLTLFPNPTFDRVKIVSTHPQNIVGWALFDLQGRRLLSGTMIREYITLSPYPAGAYILLVTDRNGQQAKRRIIKY
ncbi:MAG: T9SS type A sorting domain-containing protein, partial [Bacteroidota bacterium]